MKVVIEKIILSVVVVGVLYFWLSFVSKTQKLERVEALLNNNVSNEYKKDRIENFLDKYPHLKEDVDKLCTFYNFKN